MLVVGHLYHAARESLPWPNLSRSIWAAILRYQQRNQQPDFPAIAAILKICRRQTKSSQQVGDSATMPAESATLPTDTQGGVRDGQRK